MKKLTNIPRHVAIIMDGNGRWALARHRPRVYGHQQGAERLRDILKVAQEAGIEVVSVFAFSSENWDRPEKEIDFLTKLFSRFLKKELKTLLEKKIQLRVIGDLRRFPLSLQRQIEETCLRTKENAKFVFVIAASYGGKWDIVQAVNRLLREDSAGSKTINTVTEKQLESYLSLSDLPDPDLLIRTSGEQRISNFFLWQAAYSELYFTDRYWPDFDADEFRSALADYAARKRRFGKVL